MKKRIATYLAMVGLLVIAAGTASAQSSEYGIRAKIPFSFTVGKKTLPAGEYEIRMLNSNIVMIRTRDGKQSAVALTQPARDGAGPDLPTLVFNRYEDEYFLSQLWWGGASDASRLPKPHREQELARIAAEKTVVTGIARKQ